MKNHTAEYPHEKIATSLYALFVRKEVSRSLNLRRRISHAEFHHIQNAAITIGLGLLLAIALIIAFFMASMILSR
jgi:hypothetical protein